jgi:hypothetical protein
MAGTLVPPTAAPPNTALTTTTFRALVPLLGSGAADALKTYPLKVV